VQSLGAVRGDQHRLAGLYAEPEIHPGDVRLHDDRHPRVQGVDDRLR
jgi:hypothetical protein